MRRLISLLAVMVAAPAVAAPNSAYVVMGDGGAIARVVTADTTCPVMRVDGHDVVMTVRFAAATVPQRPTASTPENAKPSAFPVTVCEAMLPAGAKRATVDGTELPVPKRDIRRIVVIGDTGCRLKAADHAYQPCNDPAQYPFARIAASAAKWKPDLIVHVGDYQYRENPCPAGETGCTGSVWGYGWDSWRADFFGPGAPLLAVAPIAPARGNHETCNRAGQGWWRFLDGRPRVDKRDCDDPANDQSGDWSEPYAVPLGHGAQLVMLDMAVAGSKAFAPDDWKHAAFEATYQSLAALAAKARYTFAVDHHPILGFAATAKLGVATMSPGNLSIQSVFGAHGPRQLPAGVAIVLSGHYHAWEQVSFTSNQPSQFITGFSGTLEDIVPLPEHLPPGAEPAPGAAVARFASWIDGFGYMTLERTGADSWRALVHGVDGRVVNRCTITGQRSKCDLAQVPAAKAG
nr:metallophosphoesterase [Polymorphobacter sp.]